MPRFLRAPQLHDEPPDIFDVPAAVLCARCGQPDCAGCEDPSEEASGLVAIVPWERPGGTWKRLWGTARAATLSAETFFAALPDGPVRPAASFAVLAELLAVASMFVMLVPVVALALPGLAAAIVADPHIRVRAMFWTAIAIPALSVWMVVAHAAHGYALDLGVRRAGGRSQRRRGRRLRLRSRGRHHSGRRPPLRGRSLRRSDPQAPQARADSQPVVNGFTDARERLHRRP